MASQPAEKPPRRRSGRILARLALSLAAALVSLGLVELVLHLVGYWPQITQQWYLTSGLRVPSNELVVVKPHFLDPDYYAAEPGEEVIVTLGDSFTEGVPVRPPDAYPEVLRKKLVEAGRKVRLVNMGMGNSGPDQHLRLFVEHVLPHVTPDIVIWAFYANDVQDNVRQPAYDVVDGRLAPLDTSHHWLCQRQRIYEAIPLPASLKESSTLVRLTMQWWEATHREPVTFAQEGPAGKRIRLEVAEMDRLAEQHGFRVHYVLISPQSRYLLSQDEEHWLKHHTLRQFGMLLGALADREYHDVWFRDAMVGGEPNEFGIFSDETRDSNKLGDRHFNEEGYRHMADMLARAILREPPR